MISERWAEIVSALDARGIPLYRLTDPLDDRGVPSWAVLGALALVVLAALLFVVFPSVKYTLSVATTPNARVTVSYGEERLAKTAVNGSAEFRVPLGASVNVKISKDKCEGESFDLVMIDNYALERALACQ